jgi:uncharacterized membrane protein YkvA (DUF1232 family)
MTIMNSEQYDEAEEMFNRMKNEASEEDVNKINENIGKMNRGKLRDVWDSILAMLYMIRDPNAAIWEKATAIGALLYVISPIDAIPDPIPVLGLTDDVAIVALAVVSLGSILARYRQSKDQV